MAMPNNNWNLTVSGWKGTTAFFGLNNGAVSSTGGLEIGSTQGFSQTAGNGNYGYYCVDLGAIHRGNVYVDMSISIQGAGMGFWHIISSTNPFDATGGGSFDNTATQIWASHQNPTWGLIFPNNVIPRKAFANFHGRYIYIGATDLGQGQLALAIQNVVVG